MHEYEKLNNDNKIYELSNHDSNDQIIDLKKKSLHKSMYFLFENEFKILRVYIDKHLINDFIRFSQFFVETFILFVKKKNDILRLCVNYRNFNVFTIKNKYSLSLIDENLNKFSKTIKYINIDLIAVYHRLRMKHENE